MIKYSLKIAVLLFSHHVEFSNFINKVVFNQYLRYF